MSYDLVSWSNRDWWLLQALGPTSKGLFAVGLHGSIVELSCWDIFSDGFETADTSAWTTTVLPLTLGW